MFDEAIKLLQDNEPELAIAYIKAVLLNLPDKNQLPLIDESVNEEIVSTTDFLERSGWIA